MDVLGLLYPTIIIWLVFISSRTSLRVMTVTDRFADLSLHNETHADTRQMSTSEVRKGLASRDTKLKPINIIRSNMSKGKPTLVAGPMVRYSKLPFRATLRHFNCDIVYSPMILAREFVRNDVARLSDFSTNLEDTSLIVQVGANNSEDLVKFVDMIHPYVDGIGLNCGCPIKDQVAEGIGAALMSEPDLVALMIKAVKDKYGDTVCVDAKIRIHPNIDETKRFIDKVQTSGVDFITIHGRTKNTRSSIPANFDAIKVLKQHATVPVISNGDCFRPDDVANIIRDTGCDGVMAVRGILANPALFAGYEKTPWKAVELFLHYAMSYGLQFRLIQHHLSEMLNKCISNSQLKLMNTLTNIIDLIDWFDDNFEVKRKGEDGFAQRIEVPHKKQQ